jgi:hypothetical protein
MIMWESAQSAADEQGQSQEEHQQENWEEERKAK